MAINAHLSSSTLASEVVQTAALLQDRLNELIQQLVRSAEIANATDLLLSDTTADLGVSGELLGDSGGKINASRTDLQQLRVRLGVLELQIDQNLEELEVARSLTSVAAEIASQTEIVSVDRQVILQE